MTMRPYYTLLIRDDATSPWCIAFGDYDRSTVEYERCDMVDADDDWGIARNTKIIRTINSRQSTINAAITLLNASA